MTVGLFWVVMIPPTVTIAESESVPSSFSQVMLKVVAEKREPVLKDPERFREPDQPLTPPRPRQVSASVEVQVIMLELPEFTLDGLARMVTVGSSPLLSLSSSVRKERTLPSSVPRLFRATARK